MASPVGGAAEHGWFSVRTISALAVSGVLVGAFFRIETRAARPLVPPHTWKVKTLVSGTTVMLGITGLLVAAYENGSIDKSELQRRLSAVLASYRDAAGQVATIQASPERQSTIQAYRETLAALTQSGTELSKAYDDGDQRRVAAALAQSLRATAQWHDQADIGGGGGANFKRS